MPKKPMIAKKRKHSGLTADQREFLLYGRNLLTVDFPFKNERHRKELYFQHQEELLEAVGLDKRPAAWWQYSAPEPRRRIVSGDPSLAMWSKGTYFGKCRLYDIESWSDPRRPIFESQKDYLIRHNLMEEKCLDL